VLFVTELPLKFSLPVQAARRLCHSYTKHNNSSLELHDAESQPGPPPCIKCSSTVAKFRVITMAVTALGAAALLHLVDAGGHDADAHMPWHGNFTMQPAAADTGSSKSTEPACTMPPRITT
jgi:hypothetical protein